jgi:phage tail sheath protein FI
VYALEGFNLLCVPPDSANWPLEDVYPRALAYCKSRLAILLVDPPGSWLNASDAAQGLSGLGLTTNGENGAIYFPQLVGRSPSGAVAGVIARTDAARGVWKAPAGLDAVLANIPGLSIPLTEQDMSELNPLGVNCLRSFPGVGNVVWGARTLRGADALVDEFKYLPVRRLALFLEASIQNGTQWAFFEPNDEPLWASLRLSVGAFMMGLFRQGAFQGATPKDAFFVQCDAQTTTAPDQSAGIVNIVVGFAPLKPAEFVVIRISQIAGPAG